MLLDNLKLYALFFKLRRDCEEVSNLDYTNYKARMWTERPDFSAVLHEVWATMQSVEEPRVTQEDRDRAAKTYPNQKWTDADIEMLKALGHI